MKKILYFAAAIVCATTLFSCHEDLILPDPGFDMSESILDTVRRDTSSVYNISFNVKAPNGVRSIELINGRNFELLDEFDEYKGKTNFTFDHQFDFSNCDPDKDSTFIYNIKIRTNDNRGYNKTIRVVTLKKSHPQVIGPSENMTVYGRVFIFDGTIDTGYYTIEQIKLTLNGETLQTLTSSELGEVNNYHLNQQLTRDFEPGKKYTYNVEVTSSSGEVKTMSYNIVASALKKPVALKLVYGGSTKVAILHYNEKGQLESMAEPTGSYYYAFHYDNEGRLVTVLRGYDSRLGVATYEHGIYGSGMASWYQYNDDGSLRRFVEFTFRTQVNGVGTIHKMLDDYWNRNDLIPESCSLDALQGTDLEGFIYSIASWNDPAMNKYVEHHGKRYISEMRGSGSNSVGPLTYLESFEEGEMICATVPGGSYFYSDPFSGIPASGWSTFRAFAPVLNPLYINDFPTPMHWRYSGSISVCLFGTKWVPTSVSMIIASQKPDDIYPIPYSVREDGLLKCSTTLDNSIQSFDTSKRVFYFYYDDEPTSDWEPYVIAGSEERIALMK